MRIKQLFEGMMDDQDQELDMSVFDSDEFLNDPDMNQSGEDPGGNYKGVVLSPLQVGILNAMKNGSFDPDKPRSQKVEDEVNNLLDMGVVTPDFQLTRNGTQLLAKSQTANRIDSTKMSAVRPGAKGINRNREMGMEDDEEMMSSKARKMSRDDFGDMSKSDRTDDGDFKW